MLLQYVFPKFLPFLFSAYAKNSIKKIMNGYFFHHLDTQCFCRFHPQVSMENLIYITNVFCLAIISLRLKLHIYLISLFSFFFFFIFLFFTFFFHLDDFFISFQFFILFEFITPVTWYNVPFIRLYFASSRPLVVKNISPASLFMELERSKLSSLNLATFFLCYSNMFWTLSHLIFISIGFISASYSKLCCPRTEMKSIACISLFLFLPIRVNCKLCIFLSVVPAFFR